MKLGVAPLPISTKIRFIDKISQQLASTLPPSSPQLKMVVIIPAKNESESIRATLTAIREQKNKNGMPLESGFFEIIVLCHNCNDDTFKECKMFSVQNRDIQVHVLELFSEIADTVGAARRVLMNIASNRLLHENGLIISTDADTIPEKNWLISLYEYLEKDISLICGFIKSDYKNLVPQAQTYLKAKDEYLLLKARLENEILPNIHDPWPRHSFHWGPNLAIKKSVYKAIGGIQPLHFLEDVALFNTVVGKGYKVRHCMEAQVTTSTRIDSRCNEGFGAELRVWTDFEGVEYNVEGLEKLKSRYAICRDIKEFYASPSEEIFNSICLHAYISPSILRSKFSHLNEDN